jgi:hypothetical protein
MRRKLLEKGMTKESEELEPRVDARYNEAEQAHWEKITQL